MVNQEVEKSRLRRKLKFKDCPYITTNVHRDISVRNFCVILSCCLIFVAENLNTLNALNIDLLLQLPWKIPCCCSYTMLTGNTRQFQMVSGLVLVRTVLTSSHALSCLLHLLVASSIGLKGMTEDSDPLGSRRSPTGDAGRPSSPFTHGNER